MISNVALVLVSLLAAGVFFHPRLLGSEAWRATITPLASIIGSGFLIVGPILADTFGDLAWLAMMSLCAIGYLYGTAIRYNIVNIEPNLSVLPRTELLIEQASDLVLVLSYFISVAYYLNLFSAFGLRIIGVRSRTAVQIVATLAIAAIGSVGFAGGLKAQERLEAAAVGLKLSIIAGLLVALSLFGAVPHHAWLHSEHQHGLGPIQVLLGLVILVQGFETSRYLGAEHDGASRVRTMRYAQWISTAIYLGFVFLLTHLFRDGVLQEGGETAIIDMLRPLGGSVAPLLIAAALASQSSAAVADMNGASGLLAEVTGRRLSVNAGNLATAIVAIGVTWSGNIYDIITYASKAFVGYYGLQSLQAFLSAFRRRRFGEALLFAFGMLFAAAVVLLGRPAAA